jgi:hypothetical protein
LNKPADWALAYARQAEADFKGWQLYGKHSEVVASECHKLLLLQMACEKLCKAHLIQGVTTPEALQTSRAFIAKHLPIIIREQITHLGRNPGRMQDVLTKVRHLAIEIELLNPAVKRDGKRPDNCEYPWAAGEEVVSPLDWTFQPLRLVTVAGGTTFIKLLEGAIGRILEELS